MMVYVTLEKEVQKCFLVYFKIFKKKKKKLKYCVRYISTKRKGKAIRIGNKLHKSKVYLCYTSTQSDKDIKRDKLLSFDTDGFTIGIDNHTSKCLSPSLKDFISPITPLQAALQGISSSIPVKGSGTLQWDVLDDDGKLHKFIIHNALYVPGMSMRLLSPQHWAQHSNSTNAHCITYNNKCQIFGKFAYIILRRAANVLFLETLRYVCTPTMWTNINYITRKN